MIVEIKVPTPGESITEVELGKWLVEDGDLVDKDQEVAEIESDKATLTLTASEPGKIKLLVKEGDTVSVGAVACTVDTGAAQPEAPAEKPVTASRQSVQEKPAPKEPVREKQNTASREPVRQEGFVREKQETTPRETARQEESVQEKQETGPRERVQDQEPDRVKIKTELNNEGAGKKEVAAEDHPKIKITAVAEKMMEEHDLSVDDILNGLRRITKKEVEAVLSHPAPAVTEPSQQTAAFSRTEERQKMSALRRRLSERLVAVKNETAMLTTFNEVDMSRIMEIRKQYQNQFQEKHGFRLGFMAFFTKAVATAIRFHPVINSMIDNDEIITPNYVDIGIAVQSPKGLMVPIIRNAESKSIPAIELEIKELAEKARSKKITVEELTGGTFTITNGGTFGSLLSTPIINPPQSAILGMHNIQERPVAVAGKVEIRPMMYVALSYDHRLIDGKDSVSFLVRVKELLEHPERMLTGGKTPETLLLDLE